MTFVAIFVTFFLLAFLSLDKRFREGYFYHISLLFFVLFVGLRYASVDYFGYLEIYNGVDDVSKLGPFIYPLTLMTPVESGFAAAILLEKYFFGSYVFFIFMFAFFSVSIKFYVFRKMSPFFLLTILLYVSDEYLMKDMGQIRGAMASGLVLLSIYYVFHKKPVSYALSILLAISFHSAAVMAIPLYFIQRFSHRYLLALMILISFVIAYTGGLGRFLPDIASMLGFDGASRIIKYSNTKYAEGYSLFGGTVFFHLFWSAILIFNYKRLISCWNYNIVLIPVYIYGTALMLLFIDYGIISSRIREMLCVPVQAVLLPSILLLFKGQQKIIGYGLVAAYCGLYFLAFMLGSGPSYQLILLQ